MAVTATRENVHFRTSSDVKQKISDAAALMGQSITDFIEIAAVERAQQVLAQQSLVLTNEERDRFLFALENPAEPSPTLSEGAQRAMQSAREGTLAS